MSSYISKLFHSYRIHYLTILFNLIFFACSPSIKFTEKSERIDLQISNQIRVLLNEPSTEIVSGNDTYLFVDGEKVALIKANSKFFLTPVANNLELRLGKKQFIGEKAYLKSAIDTFLIINNKKYRGIIKFLNVDGTVKMLNHISLEDYIKGVMTKEMPVGVGTENYEALKAFAIAARTYAYVKTFNNKSYYDVLPDVRDQVYGGADSEHPLSNKAVDETRGMILTFDGKPAVIFYHSTCGGYTEASKNVFTNEDIPYLQTIKDGNEPYCKISPNFTWKESYTTSEFIRRLKDSNLIEDLNYSLENILIKSRFESGRINELQITVKNNAGPKTISIFGNNIRSVIKNKSASGLLKSNNFEIKMNNSIVELTGTGYGHGVGLCQWGAIAQSRQKRSFIEILSHYYPGTEINKIDD